jgi:protease II
VKVADPYRWMENDTTKAVADWVKAENEVTFGFLDKIPYRAEIKKRLEALNNYEKLGAPLSVAIIFISIRMMVYKTIMCCIVKKESKVRLKFFLTQTLFQKMAPRG